MKFVVPGRARPAMALAGVVVAVALAFVVIGHGRESTDEAHIDARTVVVAAQAGGVVTEVAADNALVEADAVVLRLDRRASDARLASAEADVSAAEAALEKVRAQRALVERNVSAEVGTARASAVEAVSNLHSTTAEVSAARERLLLTEANRGLAQKELERIDTLFASHAVPETERDNKAMRAQQASAEVSAAQSALFALRARRHSISAQRTAAEQRVVAVDAVPEAIAAAESDLRLAEARLEQARAAVILARVECDTTVVKAPFRAIVTHRTIEVGQTVTPGQQLLVLVAPDDVWVEALFKEDQIARVRPGEAARVMVDAYAGRPLAMHVESIASASAARFSLIPQDTGSGSYIKVVQRVPVRLRFDRLPEISLRAGMNAEVVVFTQ